MLDGGRRNGSQVDGRTRRVVQREFVCEKLFRDARGLIMVGCTHLRIQPASKAPPLTRGSFDAFLWVDSNPTLGRRKVEKASFVCLCTTDVFEDAPILIAAVRISDRYQPKVGQPEVHETRLSFGRAVEGGPGALGERHALAERVAFRSRDPSRTLGLHPTRGAQARLGAQRG